MYVCMYTHTQIYIYIHTYVCIYAPDHACISRDTPNMFIATILMAENKTCVVDSRGGGGLGLA